jgi:hypothetical protein
MDGEETGMPFKKRGVPSSIVEFANYYYLWVGFVG